MPTVYITTTDLEYLKKISKLDDDEKKKIEQIIDTYLKCKDMKD